MIPTQFVFFNLSAIVGSAILYGDFRRVTFHQFITFLYGCVATFSGVYLLTAGSNSRRHGEDDLEDPNADDEATIPDRLSAIPEEPGLTSEERAATLPIRILRRKRSSAAGVGLSPGQVRLKFKEEFQRFDLTTS